VAAKVAAVASLQSAAKASRLVALLRSQQFMRRYEADLAGRAQRLEQLARHWWAPGPPST
jgi:ABC-type arginine transport system ATPase subunit